jgi:hypoxanthine phosphoribosyltransferase
MEYAIKEMISRKDIAARVQEIADELNADFEGREVVFVCILKGAAIFMADLMRHLKLDMSVEFLELESYRGTESSGAVRVAKDFDADISGMDVVVVEDIVDTGITMEYIGEHLKAKNVLSVKYCVLLDNPTRRQEGCFEPDYKGFVIPNQFVLGYGLDRDGKYRQLPYIGSLVKVT